MADTLTRYLKLKVAADLSADAKYNLQQIDSLGATTITDALDNLQLRSRGNVVVEPQSLDIGGSGQNGAISLGTASSKAAIDVYSTVFRLRSSLSLLSPTNDNNKISLEVNSAHNGDATLSLIAAGNATLTVPATTGELTTNSVSQTLTNKSLSGLTNTFSNIGYSSLTLTGSIVNADISASAAIATSKISGLLTSVVGNGLGSLATKNTASLTSDVTGILPVANGGTGASTVTAARSNLLPSYSGNQLSVLRINSSGTDIEWAAGVGLGTVTSVSASAPLTITGDSTINPTINIPVATSLVDGYLSSTDWTTFNTVLTKEPAITASGNAAQFWNGNKTFAAVTKSDVGLSNVDNTSDANKPISSATQTALNAKYDASNPASYVDASGAKLAAVVNSTAGSETDQAASVSAMKSYVTSVAGNASSYTWATADGITKSITHSLNKATVSVTIYDENGEDILVDTIDRTSNNAVSLTSSQAPTGNWTVVIRP